MNWRLHSLLHTLIDNPRGRGLVDKHAKDNDLTLDAAEWEFLKYVSMRAWIQPSEIADTAYFLASDVASHITGQEISVDGNFEWEQ